MKVKPLHDHILVERLTGEEKTKGGIIIPDTAKEKPIEGKIVAVGSGKFDEAGKRIPVQLKVGEMVLFSKYAGSEVKIEGNDYLMMREDDILCVLDK